MGCHPQLGNTTGRVLEGHLVVGAGSHLRKNTFLGSSRPLGVQVGKGKLLPKPLEPVSMNWTRRVCRLRTALNLLESYALFSPSGNAEPRNALDYDVVDLGLNFCIFRFLLSLLPHFSQLCNPSGVGWHGFVTHSLRS